ncbi:MAG: hypothetical protein J6C19_02900 [Lachnospiraceae bacterium]|nr:hypothetical protein [Lachnospiraceae bacterium]
MSEYVLPLEDNTYGILGSDQTPYLSALYYTAGGEKWQLFQAEQAAMPKLLKQDDSFYESFRRYSGKSLEQCILDYTAFYNQHDYAGVCALSTGLEYSDEVQEDWLKHMDRLENGKEISHNADETEYVFQYTCFLDEQANKVPVYLTFRYIEGEGWRAAGLPEDNV